MKMNEIMEFGGNWVVLEVIILSKATQACMSSVSCGDYY